jgi:hypothetical protein
MRAAAVAVLMLALAACGAGERPGFELSAELVTPTDIRLTWRGGAEDAAANVVEFATEPSGEYTILEFLPPDRTSFEHPDLMPRTQFYYRVRPVRGPASDPVDVTMTTGSHSTRRTHSNDVGAPTNLTASVVAPDSVRFEWRDNAATEDGYLLESRPAGEREFRVVAALDQDADAFDLVTLPSERRASYRVRAYEFGEPSTLAHRTTGSQGISGDLVAWRGDTSRRTGLRIRQPAVGGARAAPSGRGGRGHGRPPGGAGV